MIDKEKIKHLAHLSRLTLNEKEIEKLSQDLKKILDYVEKIKKINLENVEPLINITENLEMREDKEIPQDSKDIISNFPEKENNYLKVPKILEK